MKPVIAHVAWRLCARALKEIWALKRTGYDVKVIAHRSIPEIHSIIGQEDLIPYRTKADLPGAIERAGADIYHCHVDPFDIATITKEQGKTVVMDVHDADPPRGFPLNPDEQEAFDCVDATVHVSEPYRDYLRDVYNFTSPSIVLYSLANKDFFKSDRETYYKGIVYQGLGWSEGYSDRFRYADFAEVFKMLVKRGIRVYAYIANRQAHNYYRATGASIEGNVDYMWLMGKLPFFEWGLVYFSLVNDQIENALPNKVFDYMAAGIPMIANRGTFFGDFIESTGIGIAVDHIDEIDLTNAIYYKSRIYGMREEWAMERHIHKLIELYEEL